MNIKSIIPAKPKKSFISKSASWSCFGLRSQPLALIMETTSQKFVQIHLIAFNNKHKLAASCHCMYKIVFHQGTCCSVLPPAICHICHICAAILCCCLQKFRYITEWKHFRYLRGRELERTSHMLRFASCLRFGRIHQHIPNFYAPRPGGSCQRMLHSLSRAQTLYQPRNLVLLVEWLTAPSDGNHSKSKRWTIFFKQGTIFLWRGYLEVCISEVSSVVWLFSLWSGSLSTAHFSIYSTLGFCCLLLCCLLFLKEFLSIMYFASWF